MATAAQQADTKARRQAQVAALYDMHPNKCIAARLGITPKRVAHDAREMQLLKPRRGSSETAT